MPFRPALILVPLLLSACTAVGPDYVAPTTPLATQFVGGDGQSLRANADMAWWRGFKDKRLNALVERGLATNLDIQTAFERIRTAEAQMGTTGINSQLQGGVSAAAQRAGGSDIPTRSTERGTLTGTFVLDLFGGARRG